VVGFASDQIHQILALKDVETIALGPICIRNCARARFRIRPKREEKYWHHKNTGVTNHLNRKYEGLKNRKTMGISLYTTKLQFCIGSMQEILKSVELFLYFLL